MIEVLKTSYANSDAYNYSSEMISMAERELSQLVSEESNDTFLKDMYLSMLLSKIKYCVKTSMVTYSDVILEIIFELERIFKIDNLIDELLGEEES